MFKNSHLSFLIVTKMDSDINLIGTNENILDNESNIKSTFQNKVVLVTGATGFIGKVLIEKILRCCEVSKIYLLMRSKKGQSIEERLKTILEAHVFNMLKRQKPNAINKLHLIRGDVAEVGLGISEEDRERLKSEVNIIYHVAATVRFDSPLREAILVNVRATREMVFLALEATKLEVFIHVSTIYCNVDNNIIKEEVYPARADWRAIIKIAEGCSDNDIMVLSEKILGRLPNSYTFTKSLAENIVNDFADRLPMLIIRPSIVSSTNSEPLPGWMDTLNGPGTLSVGVMVGLVRTMYCDTEIIIDFIPLDSLINIMMAASWWRARFDSKKCLVVNAAGAKDMPIRFGQFINMKDQAIAYPYNDSFRYPYVFPTKTYWLYYIAVLLFHVIPGYLLDTLILKHKMPNTSLMKLYRKLYWANETLSFFMTTTWSMPINQIENMIDSMNDVDKKLFPLDLLHIDLHDYLLRTTLGSKLYMLKEDPDINKTLPIARNRLRKLHWLHIVLNILFYGTIIIILYTLSVQNFRKLINSNYNSCVYFAVATLPFIVWYKVNGKW